MHVYNKGFLWLGVMLLVSNFSVFAADLTLKQLREIIKKNQDEVFPDKKNIFTSNDANKWKDLASNWNIAMDQVRTFVQKSAGGDKQLLASLNTYLGISTDILEGIRQYFTLPETQIGKAQFGVYLLNKNLHMDQDYNVQTSKTEYSSETLQEERKKLADLKFGLFDWGKKNAKLLLFDVDTALTQILQKVHKDYNKARLQLPVR